MKPTGTATAKLPWNIWIKIRKHLGQHWTYSKTLSETSRALPLSPWTWQSIFALDTCNSMPASDELLLQLGRFQNAWHPAWISWRDWKWKHVLPTTLCLKTSNQNKSKNSKSISDLWFYKWRGSCVLLHPEHPATVVVVGSLTKIHWLRPVLRRASHTLQVLEVYQSLKVNVNAVLFQWWFVCTSWFRLLYSAIVSNRLAAGRQGRTAGWRG